MTDDLTGYARQAKGREDVFPTSVGKPWGIEMPKLKKQVRTSPRRQMGIEQLSDPIAMVEESIREIEEEKTKETNHE